MADTTDLAAANLEITDEQRTKFIAHLQAEKTAGIIAALRSAGVQGSRGQLRRLYDTDVQLQEQAREARGWNINRVEGVTWEVAVNPEHPSWDRANARLLKAYGGPQFRDQSRVELTGADGEPLGVKVEHDYGSVLEKLERFGVIRRGPAAPDTPAATDQPVLPTRTD